MKLNFLLIPSLTSLAYAHFTLDYPAARGFDEDRLGTFPCGGQDQISSNRSMFPLTGGPIQLTMEHDRSNVQVLLALGNDATNAFNTVLVPTLQEEGIGKFCLSDVRIPESLGVREGDNATIQVVTNGDPNGGLYNVCLPRFSLLKTLAISLQNFHIGTLLTLNLVRRHHLLQHQLFRLGMHQWEGCHHHAVHRQIFECQRDGFNRGNNEFGVRNRYTFGNFLTNWSSRTTGAWRACCFGGLYASGVGLMVAMQSDLERWVE